MRNRIQRGRWRLLAVLVAAVSAWDAPASAGYKDDVGYTALTNTYGVVPTGAGTTVIQVEASVNATQPVFIPDTSNASFAGKTFTLWGTSQGTSWHATTVGQYFYGAESLAPGTSNVWSFSADDWINSMLRLGNTDGPLIPEGFQVVNHSWIGSITDADQAKQALRRLDAQVDLGNVTMVVGVNNGTGTAIPQLLGNAYNVIAVGVSSGNSSAGPTTADGGGRAKPDIVAPLSYTSYATPVVGAAATLLIDSALQQGKTNAATPIMIKSLLLTGAEKLSGWHKGYDGTGDDHAVPLDFQQGAGQLRVDRSYAILQSPSTPAGVTATPLGWDYGNIGNGSTNYYHLNLQTAASFTLTATLVWNRHVTSFDNTTDVVRLNDLDLWLYSDNGLGAPIDCSTSRVDNVEHLYLADLTAGADVLAVIGTDVTGSETYGLTWAAVPEPSSFLLVTTGLAVAFSWSRRRAA